MRTLLLPTDFSLCAKHAAKYGYHFARQIGADITLCNSVSIPTEVPQAGVVVWPLEEYDALIDGSTIELQKQKKRLEQFDDKEMFNPAITCLSDAGELLGVVDEIIAKHKVDMVIIGNHKHGALSTLILGNHCNRLIEAVDKPLLIVPDKARIKKVRKIAFATDLKNREKDLESLGKIIPAAEKLNADILLVHVGHEKDIPAEIEHEMQLLRTELSARSAYLNIYYRVVNSSKTEAGLSKLCEDEQVDILAMVHREHGFFDSIFKGSHTERMADHITIPLLVL